MGFVAARLRPSARCGSLPTADGNLWVAGTSP